MQGLYLIDQQLQLLAFFSDPVIHHVNLLDHSVVLTLVRIELSLNIGKLDHFVLKMRNFMVQCFAFIVFFFDEFVEPIDFSDVLLPYVPLIR